MLFESVSRAADPEFETARRQIRASASSPAYLPHVELEQSVPDLVPKRLSPPASVVDRLVRIVAGRAATRSGLDWRDWAELAQRVLNIDAKMLERVTRAWMEAGLIDLASCARWWHRQVFARAPQIVAFKIGEQFGASLSGLVLTTTVDEVRRTAENIGMLVEDRFSVSPLVPRTISIRAQNTQVLEDLASRCRVGLYWLDLSQLELGIAIRHEGTSAPPSHYERTTRYLHWSLKDGEKPDVLVQHCMRRDRPDFWLVSRNDRRLWFYDLNVTRAWAAALLGEPLVTIADKGFLDANHAFLPLPIARAVAILGFGLSGPTHLGTYRYPVGTTQLRDFALDVVSQTFDPSRLAHSTAEQMTG